MSMIICECIIRTLNGFYYLGKSRSGLPMFDVYSKDCSKFEDADKILYYIEDNYTEFPPFEIIQIYRQEK